VRLDALVAAVTPELASAVDIALRIDPRERYPTAAEMSRAIEEGARGIEPGAGTAVVPPLRSRETVALDRAQTVIAGGERTRRAERVHAGGAERTRVVGEPRTRVADDRTRRATVAQRQPRPGEQRRAAPEAEPRKGPPTGRIAAIAIGLVLVIAAIVAIVLALQTPTAVHLQNDYHGNTQTIINQLSNVISNNQS
jgi:hypothetical protein